MRRPMTRLPALRWALALLVIAAPASAQGPAALAGSYELVPEESADVRAAVRTATEGAGFFVRNVGRGVLERTLAPAPELHIRFDSLGVAIGGGKQQALHTSIGGAAVRVRNERGEREQVTTHWEGDTLVRRYEAGKAQRTYRYSGSADGSMLQVTVAVTGSILPRTLEYRLTYRRVAAGS